MLNDVIRGYLYILSGITSALIGWNISQILLGDLELLTTMPEIIIFPCIAISLAFGMIINEILISNPTRLTLSLRKLPIPLIIALIIGSILGLAAGGGAQILFAPQLNVPTPVIRILGWLIIGISVGLSEGTAWSWQSIEAHDKKRFWQRFTTSVIGAGIASLIAAFIFELIRYLLKDASLETLSKFRNIEDPMGFSILGILLGVTFFITNSPSYMAALRAGAGFEFTGIEKNLYSANTWPIPYPWLDPSFLKFVSQSAGDNYIEEGLSIQLPGNGKINIGSETNKNAHIRLPETPIHLAFIRLHGRTAQLYPNGSVYQFIAINGEILDSRNPVNLIHNDVITFYTEQPQTDPDKPKRRGEKFYRFVYYNRFLDPQA
jgi:hypothetical protein